ncbi:MAG: hypothetical protein ACYC96_03465 [Fimbriimonadaceae bacterium]
MRRLGFFGLAASLLVCGCSYKGDIVGRWKLDPAFVKKNSTGPQDNYWSSAEHDQRYEFKADHTFTGPLSAGNYTISNGHVEMFTTQVRGAKVNKAEAQTTADVSRDGKVMTLHTADDSGLPAAFQNGEPMVRDTGPEVGAPVVRMGGGPGGANAPGSKSPSVPVTSVPVGGKKK